jgi:curved DNA-binding protein CbpA
VRTHYDVLGVPATATAEEVRAAYRQAARDHHPDAGGDPRRMRDLNAAWHVLRDPGRRAAYDRQLAGRHGAAARPAPPAGDNGGGAWPLDADDERRAEDWAEEADDRPLGETRALSGWWALLPPGTLLAAIAASAGGLVFLSPELFALSGGLFVLAFGLFVLAPLRAMSRKP